MIYGGPGNDEIIDTKGVAIVRAGTGRNVIDVANGRSGDRILCAAGSIDRIYADRGDQIQRSCRSTAGSRVLSRRLATTTPPPHSNDMPLGDGSNEHPFTLPCENPTAVDCTVTTFAGGTLSNPPFYIWDSQVTPAGQCPSDHPYLLNVNHVPYGTNAPNGVEIRNLGPVGFFAPALLTSNKQVIGVKQGSVTNWTFGPQSWAVWLHCTSDINHGWVFKVGPF